MSMIVKQAAKGRKTAMISVYENNKKLVYFLCSALLQGSHAAKQATAQIFETLWQTLPEQDLSGFDVKIHLIQATVRYCQEQILAGQPEAFDPTLPVLAPDKRPHIKEGDDAQQLYLQYFLSKLNHLQRFFVVLKQAVGLNTTQVADLLQVPEMSVNVTMNQAEDTLNQAISNLKKQPDCPVHSYLEFKALVAHFSAHMRVPADLEAQIYRNITKVCTPAPKLGMALAYLLCTLILAAGVYPLATHTYEFFQKTYAAIEIEDYGTILLELDAEAAPETVANFIELAESGFYDGLTFHRIISGFMMQGGDPNGNGSGGSGTYITGEFAANGIENPISHERGVISMARAQDYNSGSSQFFIMHADYPELDGQYAAFGRVVTGIEIVDAVCASTPTTDANGTVPADYQPVIKTITIKSLM